MAYDNLKEMSLISLERILLMLNNFRSRFEIGGGFKLLDTGAEPKIDGVSEEESTHFISNLKEDNIIVSPRLLSFLPARHQRLFHVNKKRFYDFYDRIADEVQNRKQVNKIHTDRLEFDEPNSILMIQEYKIPIARRKEKTDEHDILKQLFKDKHEECFYSEMAKDILDIEPSDYKSSQKHWQKFYGACERIQGKVSKKTENKILDFLEFNSGIKGSVKINKKYIP